MRFEVGIRVTPFADCPVSSYKLLAGLASYFGVTGGPRSHNQRITDPPLCLLSYSHHKRKRKGYLRRATA